MPEQIESDIRGWDAIDEHRTGTDGDTQTAQWFADVIRQAGAEPHLDTLKLLSDAGVPVAIKTGQALDRKSVV